METSKALIASTLGKPWRISIESPIGRKESSLIFSMTDGVVSGEMTDLFGIVIPILDLRLQGNHMTWRLEITRPIKVSLVFEARMEGRRITGTIRSKYPDIAFSGVAPVE